MSQAHSSPSHNGSAPAPGQSPYQEQLIDFCRYKSLRAPNFQIVSDRRGGRTAWSCVVTVNGQSIPAQFWYDGSYVNNAREDAAQRALRYLGVLPPAPNQQAPQPQVQAQTQQQQQQQQPGHFYGAINTYAAH